MRIAIGVHGRFSAFNVGAQLLNLGEDVRLFTNYPRPVVARFGFPAAQTKSFVLHGVGTRALSKLGSVSSTELVESSLMRTFGRWLARNIEKERPDISYCWSGVAEETFRKTESLRALTRSSFHICAQAQLLADESARVGHDIDRPSEWMQDREEREYALSDVIIVPSMVARQSFAPYMDLERVAVVPLTADVEAWKPTEAVVRARQHRLTNGEKLRVLYVGNLSYQKGMYDMARVVEKLHGSMSFRFTGHVLPECAELVARLSKKARFDGHVREETLSEAYAWADVFMYGSVQDGFGVVLAQAQASALPIVATENTGAGELLNNGGRGWIVPIRDAHAIEHRLLWCDGNRAALAEMVEKLFERPPRRTWRDVAADLISLWSNERAA